MNEEEKIKKITRLLEQGCTMLAAHHDCGAPLFRCKGEILCPVCSFDVVEPDGKATVEKDTIVSKEADETVEVEKNKAACGRDLSSSVSPEQVLAGEHRENDQWKQNHLDRVPARLAKGLGESECDFELEMTEQAIRTAILFRLKVLAADIKEEKNLGRLRSQLDCVYSALRVLRSLDDEFNIPGLQQLPASLSSTRDGQSH